VRNPPLSLLVWIRVWTTLRDWSRVLQWHLASMNGMNQHMLRESNNNARIVCLYVICSHKSGAQSSCGHRKAHEAAHAHLKHTGIMACTWMAGTQAWVAVRSVEVTVSAAKVRPHRYMHDQPVGPSILATDRIIPQLPWSRSRPSPSHRVSKEQVCGKQRSAKSECVIPAHTRSTGTRITESPVPPGLVSTTTARAVHRTASIASHRPTGEPH
jgi:hypothetical protein